MNLELPVALSDRPYGTFTCSCGHKLGDMYIREGWSVLKIENATIVSAFVECPECQNEKPFMSVQQTGEYLL